MGATLSIKAATQRFLARINVPNSDPETCWLWMGGINRVSGYGVAWWGGKGHPAHRVSVALADGRWPPHGLVVLHLCDVRACVRPLHLRVGTQRENVQDAVAKGRGRGSYDAPPQPYRREPRWIRRYEEEARLGIGVCGRRLRECPQTVDGFCVARGCVQNRWTT